jgi:hypothetical protein
VFSDLTRRHFSRHLVSERSQQAFQEKHSFDDQFRCWTLNFDCSCEQILSEMDLLAGERVLFWAACLSGRITAQACLDGQAP